ncbi:MAG: DsbA family protein [Alphaproteobacteria bacterium]|jgi:protein-disulfide isomerase|nr:hypothetical protein [Rhodospirillaceae bacterium]MDP6405178.1 DsbA family protein [Alphaproteobacteria bacterium]MDP6624182.1 DsbA family protein [Alphaproteobacteria bacterium]|tara:strand:+ start:1339 stop:2094 length:756 start_codon:yes stop_codon:yes gene_type:complete
MRKTLLGGLALAAGLLLAAPAVPAAEAFDKAQKAAIEKLVHEYLMTHPEVILESVKRLEARERDAERQRNKGQIAANAEAIFHDPDAPVGGNPEGNVTLVEFFDYRCGYCKRFHPVLAKLIEADPKLRVVFKEFPILGPESLIASRAAIASQRQAPERYLAFHDALMNVRGTLNERRIMETAAELGFDTDRLRRDMMSPGVEAVIRRNRVQARKLGINGTPGFILGNQVLPGFVKFEQMMELIELARDGNS